MSRGRKAAVLLALSVGLGALACTASARPAAADGQAPVSYYVAVGASEAAGVQPTASHPWGQPTSEGYANDLAAEEAARWPGLRLVDLGCPGITAVGALDGQGRCTYESGSEVAAAVDVLRDHPDETVLVTVDLGFNDIRPCLEHGAVDEACVTDALGQVARALPVVLEQLRAAGRPHMLIVGLEHNDPFVADARLGDPGLARASVGVVARLNEELASIYRDAGAVVADVPALFGSGTGAASRMCALSWMCPLHNVHPNDAGYRAIADAVAAAVAGAEGTATGG